MWSLLTAATLLGAPSVESWVGPVRVTGSSVSRTTAVVVEGKPIPLGGDLVQELSRLQGIKVEVLGHRDNSKLEVEEYRIIDIGGGHKPLVGMLQESDSALALQDGGGDAIPLSMPARSKRRLLKKVGAKIWVYGKKLVSGELKVLRYGVLREPPSFKRPEGAGGDESEK